MNHTEQDEEIRIFDYLNILWKRKWFILIPALVLAAAAGIFGFLKTPVWTIDTIIEPGIFLVQDSNGQNRETPATETLRMARRIGLQSYNASIASELNLDRRGFPVLFAEILNNTWFIRIWLKVTDIDRGTKVLLSLLQHLKAEFNQTLDMEVKRLEAQIFEQENTIKSRQAETVLLEIQKTKSLAQIASEEAKIEISEERRRSISMEMASAKTRTDALEEQLKKAVDAQQKGNDAISLGLLLYSSQVQNNVQYYNLLDEKLNAEKVLQENSRLNIKSKTEDSKEADARIGILKNQIDNTSNAIKLIQERKTRIRYAEIIKEPSVSGGPVGPGKAMYILFGGLIGLAVFSLVALSLERRDQYRSQS